MSKIFIEFSAGLGPLIRCLPLALALRERGHTVQYFARDDAWKHMKRQGFEMITVDRDRIAFRRDRVDPNWRNGDEFWRLQGFDDLEWLTARQIIWQEALAKYQPDIIVADWGMLSSIAARVMDIPLITITQSCLHPGVRSGRMQYWLPPAPTRSSTLIAVNQYLTSRGKHSLTCFEELHVGTSATIIPSFPEFDKLEPGLEGNVFYTGPILAAGLLDDEVFLSPYTNQVPGELQIFCYTGRLNDWGGNSGELILSAVQGALQNIKSHLVVVAGGMGDRVSPVGARGLCRVDICDWLPMELAYTSSRLVVHHGGHGSCMGLFQYGVPGLVLPTQTEREYNARAVAELKCGSFVPRSDINSSSIRESIYSLLENQATVDNVKGYQQLLASKYPHSAESAADIVLAAY